MYGGDQGHQRSNFIVCFPPPPPNPMTGFKTNSGFVNSLKTFRQCDIFWWFPNFSNEKYSNEQSISGTMGASRTKFREEHKLKHIWLYFYSPQLATKRCAVSEIISQCESRGKPQLSIWRSFTKILFLEMEDINIKKQYRN